MAAAEPAEGAEAKPASEPAGAEPAAAEAAPAPSSARRKRTSGGVAVVAGGLLQDLEDRLRRDLAPVEERIRPGEELRGLAGSGAVATDPLVIVLPARPREGEPGGS